MTERLSRVQAAEAVASRWNDLGIPFVIAHGLEDYPLKLGRDLDILMDPRHTHRALHEARRTLRAIGWPTAVCPPPLWGARLVALARDGARYEYLEFHTAAELAWLALPMARADVAVTTRVGPFPINAWATFAKAVMLPLLGGDTSRLTSIYLEKSWRWVETAAEIVAPLTQLIGARLAGELVTTVVARDPQALLSLQPVIRRRCLLSMLTHPTTTGKGIGPFVKKRFGRLLSNSGARVRLTAPGAHNAFQLASNVAEELEHIFVDVRVERPRAWLGRLVQQFNTLSRQGLVIETEEDFSRASILLVALRGTASLQSESFSQDQTPELVARWIVENWADSLSCS